MSTLAVCLIVKNEEKNLEKCLKSIEPICNEIIIVDTGSTDNTKEIAKGFKKASIYDFEWEDDFSAARNFSLEKASTDWIFVIDADEVISTRDYEHILRCLDRPSDGFYMLTKNYTKNYTRVDFVYSDDCPEAENLPGYTPSHKTRIFRNKPEYKFRGRIHEVVDQSILDHDGVIEELDVPLHHYGNQDITKEKMELYKRLATKKVEDEPTSPMAHYELGQIQVATGEIDEGIESYKKGLELNPNFGDYRYGNLNYEIGNTYYQTKNDPETALEYYLKAIEVRPGYKFVYSMVGAIYRKKMQFDLAEAYLQEAVLLKSAIPNTYYDLGLTRYHQGRNYDAIQCFETVLKMAPEYIGAYNNLAINYHLIGEIEKAKTTWRQALELDPDHSETLLNLEKFNISWPAVEEKNQKKSL